MKRTLRISFNGKTFEVVAELLGDNEPSASGHASAPGAQTAMPAASAPAASAAPVRTGGAGDILCPLAGKVVSIDARVGEAVKAGQAVVTLEAMKMNTVVSSAVAGTVAAVHVNPGDSVEEGRVLMTLR